LNSFISNVFGQTGARFGKEGAGDYRASSYFVPRFEFRFHRRLSHSSIAGREGVGLLSEKEERISKKREAEVATVAEEVALKDEFQRRQRLKCALTSAFVVLLLFVFLSEEYCLLS